MSTVIYSHPYILIRFPEYLTPAQKQSACSLGNFWMYVRTEENSDSLQYFFSSLAKYLCPGVECDKLKASHFSELQNVLHVWRDWWLLDRVRFSIHFLKLIIIFVAFCINTDSATWQQLVILWRLHCDLRVNSCIPCWQHNKSSLLSKQRIIEMEPCLAWKPMLENSLRKNSNWEVSSLEWVHEEKFPF